MKILLINSAGMQKIENKVCISKSTGKFLELLLKEGIQVNLFHFLIHNHDNSNLAGFNLLRTNISLTMAKRYNLKIFSYVLAYFSVLKELKRCGFLYMFYPNSFYPLLLFSLIMGKPYGLYIRGERKINSFLSKFFFKRAKFIMTISPNFTNQIKRLGGKAYTIRPMIDFSDNDILIDRSYNNKEVYTFLFLGRVELEKGIFDLIEAIKQLNRSGYSNFILKIVGDGPDIVQAKKIVSELGLTQRIIFYAPVFDKERIKFFYKNSDIFVLPTHHEGFPRVLYEAMIFGVPIVTTFVGTIRYLMKDGFNCYEIEPKNPSDLVDKLISFLDNYKKKSKVALNGTLTIRDYLKSYNKSHGSLFVEELRVVKN